MKKTDRKKLGLIIGVIVVALIVVFIAIFLIKNGREQELEAAKQLPDQYTIDFIVKRGSSEVGELLYQVDKTKGLHYLVVSNTEEMIDKMYFDETKDIIYYQNVDTNVWSQVEQTTSFCIEDFLNKLDKSYWDGVQNRHFTLPYQDFSSIYQNEYNLLTDFLESQGYFLKDEDTNIDITYANNRFETITLTMPTTDDLSVTIEMKFSYNELHLQLPNMTAFELTDEERQVKWMILYLQRIFATEPQTEKVIVDTNYLLDSAYKEEISSHMPLEISDIRVTLIPTTDVNACMVNGTITFENGVVATIQQNQISWN